MRKWMLILQLFAVGALSAEEFRAENYKGKVLYVDFWASWCAPCKKSFPWMNSLKKRFGQKGFEIVAINLDREKKLADNFLMDTPADFQVLFDPGALNAKKFEVRGMPSSAIFNRNGKLIKMQVGFREGEITETEKLLIQLLNEEKR